MPRARLFPKRQRGFLIETLGLVLLILSALALKNRYDAYQAQLDSIAVAQGGAMTTVANVGQNYLVNYYNLILAMPAPGAPIVATIGSGPSQQNIPIAHGDAPTVAELVQLGLTPPNFSSTPPIGGTYIFQMQLSPTGCTPPNCNIEGQVYINAPYVTNSKVDYPRLGLALQTIGTNGGFSQAKSPTTISGYAGGWSVPNPVSGNPGGILAAQFGYSSSGFAAYYRRDGALDLTGPMNGGGQSIGNVTTVSATSELLTSQMTVGAPCTDNGAYGSGPGVAMVCVNNTWQINGQRSLPGQPCSPDGTPAISNATGEGLVCKNSLYVRSVNMIPVNINRGRVLVADQQLVPQATCEPGGTSTFSFQLNSTTVDVTQNPPLQGFQSSASASGANWLISIVLVDDQGNTVSGNSYHATELFNLECKY